MKLSASLLWKVPCAVLLLLVWYYKLLPLLYFWLITNSDEYIAEWRDSSLWLPGYQVAIDALPIEGIEENLSGLTFNRHSRTLFGVTNSPRYVAELSLSGELLRWLPIIGAGDTEGITHVEDDLFIIADEEGNQLYWVRINDETESIMIDEQTVRLVLGGNLFENTGFEGVSWDHERNMLYLAKEKLPMRIIRISGLENFYEDTTAEYDLQTWKSPWAQSLFMADLSSLALHEDSGHLLAMSHESSMIIEYGPAGEVVSIMPLWRERNGLRARIPQAEGVALDDEGNIYIVSEPNLFYVFRRTGQAAVPGI